MEYNINGIDLLGSTGSIGEQAVDVARKRNIRIRSICAGRNYKRVEEQAREFRPAFCAMYEEEAAKALRLALADTDIRVLCGEKGICQMIEESDADVSLNAIIGQAGLLPTLSVIKKGKRLALPNSEIMIHQPLGGAQGQASDIKIRADLILRTRDMLNKILAENTGKSIEQIERDTDRDNFMTAEQALEYGLIDKIYTHRD